MWQKSNSIGLIANILIKESDCGNILLALWLFFERRKGVDRMGKDLKGKELGPGVMQRKDGDYSARW